ncbi:hypothetical protein [Gordonia aichiensis]
MGTTVSPLTDLETGTSVAPEVDDSGAPEEPEAGEQPSGESVSAESESDDAEPEAAPSPPADSTGSEQDSGPTRGRQLLAFLVGCALIVAGIAYGAVMYGSHRDAVAARDRDAQLLTTTREMAADLVTLRHGSADADVDRVRSHATGDFKSQISDTTGSFSTILKQGQVDSEGKARQVAVVSADDNHATTIAAVTSTVKNSETPEGQQRVYRMKLDLEQHDGKWLVSNVEFVS